MDYIPVLLADMSVGEIFGWVKSLLDTLGITPFLYAFIILAICFAFLAYFRRD